MGLPVYLDNAASTPVDPRVAERMAEALRDPLLAGNPSSGNHAYGAAAQELIAQARNDVAALVNGDAGGIIWTSGATESDNLAILGGARYKAMHGKHIISSVTEHSAVLGSLQQLREDGFEVTLLHPDSDGRIDVSQVSGALTDGTVLVSLMHANNETGVIQDIAAVGALCRERDVLFHVDAAQSAGRLPLDVAGDHIDLLSLSAHKLYGPKGVGALWLNRQRISRLEPLMFGGGHEQGLRPGTPATHQIIGMGEAFRIAAAEMAADVARIGGLREQLWAAIQDIPGLVRNSAGADTLCSILSVSVPGVEGESLLFALRKLAVSSGSACNSDSDDASYVMRSLGHDDQLAQSTIRFSLGRFTTAADIGLAATEFRAAVDRLRLVAGG